MYKQSQGKENRIIILSLTRSDKQHSPGFLRVPNRINVARRVEARSANINPTAPPPTVNSGMTGNR
ncbi:AAA domain-containing protein [Escherichia coli]|nr:AAA domain-containing protein [Escherichia coli]